VKNAWIVMLAIMMGCSKVPLSAEPADIPVWLQTKIKSLQAMPEANPPRSISKTIFEGETAYYVSPACCDIPSELYKADGTLRCYPSGGIAGGDGRCPAFSLDRQRLEPVWRDERSSRDKGTPVQK
jgi:hypothetical protein